MRIGIDFDNTIANYDQAFPTVARILGYETKTNNKRDELITELTKLSDILYTALNTYTLKLMKASDMYPIARRFLP